MRLRPTRSATPWNSMVRACACPRVPVTVSKLTGLRDYHNGAAFIAYALPHNCGRGEMRLFLGLILGCAITIGGAYVADNMSAGPGVRPMVNWDVVAKNIDSVVALARDGWKKITG